MNIFDMGITQVAAITVICYLIGIAVKAIGSMDKYIPTIVGTCGAVLGVAAMYVMPNFAAQDILTAVAVGIVSGLASTGVHQAIKQVTKGE